MDNCIMAEHQFNRKAIATSSSAAKWWADDVHASSICSWTGGANYVSNPPCNNPQKPNSNCSNGEEDVNSISTSFTTNASNNSGLSMESSRRLAEKTPANDPYGEVISDNHHLWNQVLLDAGTTGELQNIPTSHMFELPACDYLKNLESGWEFSGAGNINLQFQKNLDFKDGLQTKIPSAVNCWSIAPPEDEISPQFDQYIGNFTTIKNEQHPDANTQHDQGLFPRRLIDYEACININQIVNGGDHNRRKPDLLNSYQPIRARGNTLAKMSGRGNGVVNEGKKKKSEDQSGPLLKKTKLETSTVSSTKVQIPKAKLGDKITAIQQIVSPFGKTDTASVLWEAIGYIKCLQEQVQLLSNPYLKTNIIKDSWMARYEAKDRGNLKLDLKSRGLCLVPVSCTPQVYHENNGTTDYWTPTYRGCFYR